jgi:fructose-1,6-bisphosphatase II
VEVRPAAPRGELTGALPGRRPRSAVPSDLVLATEAAALASARQLGRAAQERVREVAAGAMLDALEGLGMAGRVVVGQQGDQILSQGTWVGHHQLPGLDLAVYPVEGANLVARGLPGAISMLVAVEPDAFPVLPAVWYVDRIVAGPSARGAVDLEDPLADNLRRIAFARDARVSDLVVAVLDRPRHQGLIQDVKDIGARLVVLEEGDVAGALMAASEDVAIDCMVGIGGLQESVMAACAVKCLGGEMQARFWPRNEDERLLAGADLGRVLTVDDLAPDLVEVAITGVSGGDLLDGVSFASHRARTDSLTMSSRLHTIRRLRTQHHTAAEST